MKKGIPVQEQQKNLHCSTNPVVSVPDTNHSVVTSALPIQFLPGSTLPTIRNARFGNNKNRERPGKNQIKAATQHHIKDNAIKSRSGAFHESEQAEIHSFTTSESQKTTNVLQDAYIEAEEKFDFPAANVLGSTKSFASQIIKFDKLKFFKKHDLTDPLLESKKQKHLLKWIGQRCNATIGSRNTQSHYRAHSCPPPEWDRNEKPFEIFTKETTDYHYYGGRTNGRHSALGITTSQQINHSIEALRKVAGNEPVELKVFRLPPITPLVDERVVAERLFKGLPAWDSMLLSGHGGKELKSHKNTQQELKEDVRTTQLATAAMIKAHAASLDKKATVSIEASVTEFCEHGDNRLNDMRIISKGSISKFDMRLGGLRKLKGDFGIISEKNDSVQRSANKLSVEMQRIEAFLNSGLDERIRKVFMMPELQQLMKLNLIPYESNKRRTILSELYKDVAVLRRDLAVKSEELARKFAKLTKEVEEREDRLSGLLIREETHVPLSETEMREIKILKDSILNAYLSYERDPQIKQLEELTSRLLDIFVQIETTALQEEDFARKALSEYEAGAQHRAELQQQQALEDMKKKISWLVEENAAEAAQAATYNISLILDRILQEPDVPEHRRLGTQNRLSLIPRILDAKFAGLTYVRAELDTFALNEEIEKAQNERAKKKVILGVEGTQKTDSLLKNGSENDLNGQQSIVETSSAMVDSFVDPNASLQPEADFLSATEVQNCFRLLEELHKILVNHVNDSLSVETFKTHLRAISQKLPTEIEERMIKVFDGLDVIDTSFFVSRLGTLLQNFDTAEANEILLSQEQQDQMKLLLGRWRNEHEYEALRSWRYYAQKMREERDRILHTYGNLCDRLNIPGLAVMPLTQALHTHNHSDFDISGKGISNLGMKALLCAMHGREPDFQKTMSDTSVRDADRLASISTEELFAFKLEHADIFQMRELMSFTPLKRLIFKDNDLKGSGAQALVKMLMGCTVDLDELDLESNNIGDKGGLAIAELLSALPVRPVRRLNLARNKLGDAASAAVLQALAASVARRQALSPTEYLLHLDLSRNEAADLTAEQAGNVLSEPRLRLRTLNLSWNLIRQEAATILFEGLRGNKSLKYLNMEWNGLGSTNCCFQIGEALGTCALHTLNLSRCRISAAGTSLISNGIIKNKELELLILDGNSIMQTGARTLFKAKLECNRDAGSPQLTISTNDCNIEVKDASCFDISEPAGAYSLDMKLVHNRQVLLELMRLVSSGKGRFLNSPSPEIDEFYTDQFQPYRISMDSKVEDDWWIPEGGILRFTFGNNRVAAAFDESLAASDRELNALGDELFDPETSSKQWTSMIRAQISGNTFLRFEQAVALLRRIDANKGMAGIDRTALSTLKVEVVKHSYNRLIDQERNFELFHYLDPLERSTVEKYLGPTAMNFTQNNPTGFYHLNLAVKSEREVFMRLIELYNAQTSFWDTKRPWYSTRAGGARPEVNICWRHSRYDGLPHDFSNSWPVPNSGIYQLEFVQITKPSSDICPATEAEIRQLISEIHKQHIESENLTRIRRWSNSHLFTCEQVDKLLEYFREESSRVELCVIAFSRTLDWHGYVNILTLLNPAEYKLLRHRLSMLNLFDDISAVGYYELDLAIPEDRFVAQELVHLAIEEPGDNILDCQYNGVDMTITGGWAKSMPVKGLLSFYYCRELECIRQVSMCGAWTTDGYPHPLCIDGQVPQGHRSQYKSWIVAKFCEAGVIQPAGRLWIRDHKLRSIIFKMKSVAASADEMFKMLDRDGGGSLDSRELAAGLFRIGVWLHPLELQALVQVLDADGGGTISVEELRIVWNNIEQKPK